MSEIMGTADTSLMAYRSIQETLTDKQRVVLRVLRFLGVANNMQIAKHLDWGINRVTGRVKELRDKGAVELAVKKQCPITGNTAKFWKIKLEQPTTLF